MLIWQVSYIYASWWWKSSTCSNPILQSFRYTGVDLPPCHWLMIWKLLIQFKAKIVSELTVVSLLVNRQHVYSIMLNTDYYSRCEFVHSWNQGPVKHMYFIETAWICCFTWPTTINISMLTTKTWLLLMMWWISINHQRQTMIMRMMGGE